MSGAYYPGSAYGYPPGPYQPQPYPPPSYQPPSYPQGLPPPVPRGYEAAPYGVPPDAWQRDEPRYEPPRYDPREAPPAWRPEDRPAQPPYGYAPPSGTLYDTRPGDPPPGWTPPGPDQEPAPYGSGAEGNAAPPRDGMPPYLGGRWSRDEENSSREAPSLGPRTWQ